MFVDLGILNAMRMRRLLSVACSDLQYFPALSHKGTIFWKKKLLAMKYVFRISLQIYVK